MRITQPQSGHSLESSIIRKQSVLCYPKRIWSVTSLLNLLSMNILFIADIYIATMINAEPYMLYIHIIPCPQKITI